MTGETSCEPKSEVTDGRGASGDPLLYKSAVGLKAMSGSTVSCRWVSYQVPISKGCLCCKKTEQAQILSDISAVFRPGMSAILGPTGSGKTSLLDILAGRKDPSGLSGHVLVNGKPQPVNFKCMSGYVLQDDILMGMLTVRENIAFSAALRLPSSMSAEQRAERIQEVIDDLGLSHCADTKVGTAFRRGVSGGERKRTCIAMELITSPQILFLDEPTTGLDAFTAQSVMLVLQRLSRKGKTIIFSVHQPRYSIYKLCNHTVLLSHGRMIYDGPAAEALAYFGTLGYTCEEHNNPADFFLDVLQGACSPQGQGQGGVEPFTVTEPKENGTGDPVDILLQMEESEDAHSVRHRVLTEQFRKSDRYQKLQEELKIHFDEFDSQERSSETAVTKVAYPTSFFTQLRVVSARTFRNMVRNPHTLATQVASAVILGLIVGAIYWQVDTSYKSGIQNRVGAFFFIVMNHVFGNMAAVDLFIKERALFIHENSSGYYRVSAYFLAKWFCDVLPMKFLPVLVFSSITYWMVGLQPQFNKFLFYVLNTLTTSLAGTGVALILSASVNVHTIGTILTALVWVFMMVFSGLLVNLETIAAWLQWLKYFSIFRYSMNSFIINELKGMTFCSYEPVETPEVSVSNYTATSLNGSTLLVTDTEYKCDSGNDYMRRQGIKHMTSYHLWMNQMALLVLTFVFLCLTYLQLRRIKKLK